MNRYVAFVAAAAIALSVSLGGQTKPVRVYVYTAEPKGGFIDEAYKERQATVKDLLQLLKPKTKEVALVKTADEAELKLEVVSCETTESASGAVKPGYGDVRVEADKLGTIVTKLSVGDYSTEIKGTGTNYVRYKIAAGRITDSLVKWIKDNDAKIPRK